MITLILKTIGLWLLFTFLGGSILSMIIKDQLLKNKYTFEYDNNIQKIFTPKINKQIIVGLIMLIAYMGVVLWKGGLLLFIAALMVLVGGSKDAYTRAINEKNKKLTNDKIDIILNMLLWSSIMVIWFAIKSQ